MHKTCGLIVSVIFALLGAIHCFWALGGTWGRKAVLPTKDGKILLHPTKRMTWAVALALFGAMVTVLGHMHRWHHASPRWIFRWGMRGMSLVFFLRALGDFHMLGFFKTIRGTRFAAWDTWLFSPLCLLIAVLCAVTEGAGISSACQRRTWSTVRRILCHP